MKQKQKIIFLLFPSLFFLFGFFLFPVMFAFYLSFFNVDTLTLKKEFIGLANYLELLTDPKFYFALKNSFIYGCVSTIIEVGLGIGIALILNERLKGISIIRGISIFPYVIPIVVSVVLWRWMLDVSFGIINWLTELVGFQPIPWLGGPLAMVTLVIVSVWIFTPFIIVTTLAALQQIPESLYDAAKIDGTNALQRFYYITLPQLREVMSAAIIIRWIWMFNKFDVPYALWGVGGSGIFITNLPIYAYITTYNYYRAGYGNAICVIMTMILVASIAILLTFFKQRG